MQNETHKQTERNVSEEDFQSGVVLLLAVVALALGRFIEIMQSS